MPIIGLYHPLDAINNPKYELLNFLTTIFFTKRRMYLLLIGIGTAINRSV
jgi:hypothetical protein